MAAPQIKFKRGAQANLPALAAGEPAFVNDEYNLKLIIARCAIKTKI